MTAADRRDLERLRYWQGQTLRSRDYRDQDRFDQLRRQLHNRVIHGTGGVSFGLAVTRPSDNPAAYEVECGLAHDCNGREIVLQRSQRIGPPDEPSVLIVRLRRAVATSFCCESTDPGCLPEDALLLDREVELVWLALDSFEPIDGVVLARVSDAGFDSRFRPRQARPMAKPRLARGRTVRGNTVWEPWSIDEPDPEGKRRRKLVGVETRIDTSAAGFTSTPHYFASIEAPAWDLASAEFAPAFFPHIADPSIDGFTFRLLMVETARRRYAAEFGTARAKRISRGVGDRLLVDFDDVGPIQKGDMIALLRPRARSVVRVKAVSGSKLTLAAPLGGGEVVPGTTVLAVGNLPRVAIVSEVVAEDRAILAAFASPVTVKKADVLMRQSDQALAVVDGVQQGKLLVGDPFSGWKAADPLAVARLSGAVEVKNATLSPDGLKMLLELKPASHGVDEGLTIVSLDQQKAPLARPAKVTKRNGANIEVEPPLSAADIGALKRVAPFAFHITIESLQRRSSGMVVKVNSVASFAPGDFVAAADASSTITTVEKVSGSKELLLNARLPLKPGSVLVAANWRTATTVAGVAEAKANDVTVGREQVAPPGTFVARREGSGFSRPSIVKSASGRVLTLSSPIEGLKRLDTLAVGVFPRVATVMAQHEQEERLQIVEQEAVTAGDEVALVTEGATAMRVAQVLSASGNEVVLGASLGKLASGEKLAVLGFRDAVLLSGVDSADQTRIEVDPEIAIREGDVVGAVTHYADNSNPGLVEGIRGNQLTLGIPGLEHGDGIVDEGWIDGGIVGPAAVTYLSLSQLSIPSQLQPVLRLATIGGIDPSQPAIAYGFDLLTGRFGSSAVRLFPYDPAGRHIYVVPVNLAGPFRYRPETLSILTTFNTDFPRAFAVFAQKQGLSVCWVACQDEFPRPSGCPAQEPHDPCGDPGSERGTSQ